MAETEDEAAKRRERERQERDGDLARVPLRATFDKSKWPKDVRTIAWKEIDGLGVDSTGRLHWDGKPVEIIGQRLDLTWWQTGIALAVALFTLIAAAATVVQAWTALREWKCKIHAVSADKCPADSPIKVWGD